MSIHISFFFLIFCSPRKKTFLNYNLLKDFSDAGAFWLREYESDTIKEDIEELWQTLKPFYQQMHAYVRAKLRETYKDQITEDGLIPAHLLGN